MHVDTWASGHAADQNWTPSQSQKVEFEMEGIGRVRTEGARKQTQLAYGPFCSSGSPLQAL